MKKILLSLVLGIGLLVTAVAQGQSFGPANSAVWNSPVTSIYTNVNYNVVATIPNVTAARVGAGPTLPAVGNGIISAINIVATNVLVSSFLPTSTTPGGSYVVWVQSIGTSGGVVSAASWVTATFTYAPPALPSVTNLKIQ